MAITRRQVIVGGLAAGAVASLPLVGRRARARTPCKLVMVLNYGGWDTTYSIDPKPGLPLIDVAEGTERRFGNIPIWSHPSRPNVDRFFERWAPRTTMVHGVQVRSFVHTDCIKRVLTGSPSETAPDLGAMAAFELAPDLPVPYLALGSQARSGPLASITGRAGTSNQLVALVDPEAAYAQPGGLIPDQGLIPTGQEQDLVAAFIAAGTARLRATRGQRGYNKRRIDDFAQSIERADRLARFVRDGASLGARDYTPQLEVQIPLAVQALRDGLSQAALLQSSYSWDTHSGNNQQSMFHDGLFGSLDTLCAELESADLLDQTLVVVMSEMGRTPKLNGQQGKDHWPVTSCFMLGASVPGDRVLGGTNDELGARSVDLETGELDSAGTQLQAANLAAGILSTVGVDASGYLPGTSALTLTP